MWGFVIRCGDENFFCPLVLLILLLKKGKGMKRLIAILVVYVSVFSLGSCFGQIDIYSLRAIEFNDDVIIARLWMSGEADIFLDPNGLEVKFWKRNERCDSEGTLGIGHFFEYPKPLVWEIRNGKREKVDKLQVRGKPYLMIVKKKGRDTKEKIVLTKVEVILISGREDIVSGLSLRTMVWRLPRD